MSLFFLFLGIAAWQDLRTRSISLEVLTAGAAAGMAVCVLEGRGLEEIVPAMIPGIALLLINRFGGWELIGEGDGLFFLVAGFFLEWKEIVLLLISGQFFCGIFGLAMAVSVMTIGGRKRESAENAASIFAISASDCVVVAVMRVYEGKKAKESKIRWKYDC